MGNKADTQSRTAKLGRWSPSYKQQAPDAFAEVKGKQKDMTFGWLHRKEAEASLIPSRGSRYTKSILLTCPVVFSGFIAMYSRSYNDPFNLPASSPAQEAAVMAYVPYVAETKAVFAHGDTPRSREAMLTLAKKWDLAVQAKELHPLVPVSFEDSPELGARGEVTRAKGRLVSGLLDDARKLADVGKADIAAEEVLLATRLSESLKYSDLNGVYLSSAEQQRATVVLNKIAKCLDAEDKAAVRSGLLAIQANAPTLELVTRYSRTQYYDWLRRMSKTPVSIEDIHRTVLVTERIASDPSSEAALKFVRRGLTQAPVDSGPEYLSELRVAWAAENASQKQIKRLLTSL
jgi:hypothetical protein